MIISLRKLREQFPRSIRRRLPRTIIINSLSSAKSRVLNRRYRGKDTAANVLSFRYGPDYGEILICKDVIRREARARGENSERWMLQVIVHAMVHLAGIHHEASPRARRRAAALEAEIVRLAALPSFRKSHRHGKNYHHSA